MAIAQNSERREWACKQSDMWDRRKNDLNRLFNWPSTMRPATLRSFLLSKTVAQASTLGAGLNELTPQNKRDSLHSPDTGLCIRIADLIVRFFSGNINGIEPNNFISLIDGCSGAYSAALHHQPHFFECLLYLKHMYGNRDVLPLAISDDVLPIAFLSKKYLATVRESVKGSAMAYDAWRGHENIQIVSRYIKECVQPNVSAYKDGLSDTLTNMAMSHRASTKGGNDLFRSANVAAVTEYNDPLYTLLYFLIACGFYADALLVLDRYKEVVTPIFGSVIRDVLEYLLTILRIFAAVSQRQDRSILPDYEAIRGTLSSIENNLSVIKAKIGSLYKEFEGISKNGDTDPYQKALYCIFLDIDADIESHASSINSVSGNTVSLTKMQTLFDVLLRSSYQSLLGNTAGSSRAKQTLLRTLIGADGRVSTLSATTAALFLLVSGEYDSFVRILASDERLVLEALLGYVMLAYINDKQLALVTAEACHVERKLLSIADLSLDIMETGEYGELFIHNFEKLVALCNPHALLQDLPLRSILSDEVERDRAQSDNSFGRVASARTAGPGTHRRLYEIRPVGIFLHFVHQLIASLQTNAASFDSELLYRVCINLCVCMHPDEVALYAGLLLAQNPDMLSTIEQSQGLLNEEFSRMVFFVAGEFILASRISRQYTDAAQYFLKANFPANACVVLSMHMLGMIGPAVSLDSSVCDNAFRLAEYLLSRIDENTSALNLLTLSHNLLQCAYHMNMDDYERAFYYFHACRFTTVSLSSYPRLILNNIDFCVSLFIELNKRYLHQVGTVYDITIVRGLVDNMTANSGYIDPTVQGRLRSLLSTLEAKL